MCEKHIWFFPVMLKNKNNTNTKAHSFLIFIGIILNYIKSRDDLDLSE